MTAKISILLPTFNCADIVERTLQSIAWADEILVVDSYSTDETLEIVKRYGARTIQHEYINSAKQKNWAVGQCVHEWVLQIDSDETLEPGLEATIKQAVATAPQSVEAFKIARKNHILGEWVQYGGIYPDYQTRLFRRECGRWIEREVHAHIQVTGETKILDGNILHYGMPHLSKQLRNLDRYTRYEADEAKKQGQHFRISRMLLRPLLIFGDRYVRQRGFRAGWRGFYLAAYLATYEFWLQAKLWELQTMDWDHSPR